MKTISSNSSIMGGTLVVSGTRIPVTHIIHLLLDNYTLESIQEMYPHVSKKKLRSAVNEAISMIDSGESYASKTP